MNRALRRELGLFGILASGGLLLAKQKTWATALAFCTAGLQLLPVSSYSTQGRSVLITGGSRGLGFALAEAFLHEGAHVTLLARDPEELAHAKRYLEKTSPGRVFTIACDLTQPAELKQAFSQAETHFGRIDILVNNAGAICVGPFEAMEPAEFEAQLDLHLCAVVDAIQTIIPIFRRHGEGRIVNITSIGGILPVPHMSTYCASKFAMAGLSETLSAELAAENIRVTTVYPALMRTGSPIQAVFKGNHEKEYGWFATSDVIPGLSVSAKTAAQKIIDGIRHEDSQIRYPALTSIGIIGHALFPETYALFNRQVAKRLPKGKSHIRKTGAESQGWLERQAWYWPLKQVEQRAEARLNQQEKIDADFNLGLHI